MGSVPLNILAQSMVLFDIDFNIHVFYTASAVGSGFYTNGLPALVAALRAISTTRSAVSFLRTAHKL